jgi:sugar/nucleoside kinase (ribokinase family)
MTVATLGSEGSLARFEGREIRTPAITVEVLDTTGAGDAFRGGLASAWLRAGNGAQVDQLLRYANAVAALNCRAVGAQAGLPTPTEVAGVL